MDDEGGPLGDGLQDQSSKHPALLGYKTPGGERSGKRRETYPSVENQEGERK